MTGPGKARRRDLAALPKAHLHTHFLGSARESTLDEIAHDEGVTLPDLTDFTDIGSFVSRYVEAEKVIQRPQDVERIIREIVEDAAADGVTYLEQSFNPNTYAHRFGMSADELFDLMDRTFQREGQRNGVTVRYMVTVNRGIAAEYLAEAAEFAVAHKNRNVVAFGYGGDEDLGDEVMTAAVDIARRGGLFIVPHAGETTGPRSVRDALELHPRRIAHGIGARADQALLRELARRHVTLDMSPTSNVRMGAVKRIEDYPLRQFVDAGVPVTLNADDELFFGSSILQEYQLARDVLGMDDDQIAQIARNSFQASGAPRHVIHQALRSIDHWLHDVGPQERGVSARHPRPAFELA